MALQIRGNSQIINGPIENAQIKNADLSLSKLSGSGSVEISSGASMTFASGSSLTIDSADINGGTLDGVTIGGSSPAVANVTTLSAQSLSISDTTEALADGSEGAVIVAGGAYVAKKLFVGTDFRADGDVQLGSDANDTVTVKGNLVVDGTSTTINSTTLEVDDKTIVLNKGSIDSATGDGGGLIVEGPTNNATILWDHNLGSGRFKINQNVLIEGSLGIESHLTSYNGNINVLDSTNSTKLAITASNGNLVSQGQIQAVSGFSGNLSGNVSGNLTGDVYASNGTSKVLESGTDGSDATFTGDVTGDLTGNADTASAWANSRTVSFSGGDVSGSFSMDGSADVSTVDLTIGAGVVENSMLAGSITYDKIESTDIDTDLNSVSTDHDTLASAKSIKNYVDAQISGGGFTSVADMDLQMGDNGSFVRVKKEVAYISVDSTMAGAATPYVDLADATGGAKDDSTASLQALAMVFLNGQKLRLSSDSGSTNEYYWDSSDAGKILFASSIISDGDDVEIHYYIKYA